MKSFFILSYIVGLGATSGTAGRRPGYWKWLQTLTVVRAEDTSSEAFVNVYNVALERLEPLATRDPACYYDLLRLILTWGL